MADALSDTDSLPAVDAADWPSVPGTGAVAGDPATDADEQADTGWFQPAVPSSVPYEFPSTGSVRLLPPAGRGNSSGPAGGSSPPRFRAPAPRPATPAGREPGRPAASATPPAAVAAPRANAARANAAAPPAGAAARANAARANAAAPPANAAPRVTPRPATAPAPTAPPSTAPPSTAPPATAPTAGAPTANAPAEAVPPAIVIPASPGQPSAALPGTAGSAGAGGVVTAAPAPRLAGGDLFARHIRSYAAENSGQQITILQAGCTTAEDLGVDALRAAGARLSVSLVDDDNEVTRAAVAQHPHLADAILGDLRAVQLPPRAFDIVQCSGLLTRIEHADLVLDRLTSAVKPGGLLLLRICDRDSAAGFLDRVLPGPVRTAIWRKRQPDEPGPYAPVYGRLASPRGIQAYVLRRGLVVAERGALGGLAGGLPRGPVGYLTAQKLAAQLSGGRVTATHEDLLYVIRKPEDRFARLL